MEASENRWPTAKTVAKWVLVTLGLVGLALLLWQLRSLLLLVFGAVIVATLIRSLADPISSHTPIAGRWAALLSALLILIVLGLAGWLFGYQVASQFQQLSTTLPDAWAQAQGQIASLPMGERILEQTAGAASDLGSQMASLVSRFGGLLASFAGAVIDLVLVIFAGLYLATDPTRYREGFLQLIPGGARQRTGRALENSGRALKRWLVGQLISMTLVGVLVGLGAWAIGLPAPLALGLLAGLAEFVPLVGPIAAAVPGVLLGLTEGPTTALWALALYVAVQQLESNLIMPLIQRRMLELPPALTLIGVVAFGLLFGPLGVLFAAPLLVVAFVLTKTLWVRDALGEETEIPGSGQSDG